VNAAIQTTIMYPRIAMGLSLIIVFLVEAAISILLVESKIGVTVAVIIDAFLLTMFAWKFAYRAIKRAINNYLTTTTIIFHPLEISNADS
jgi:hypothetical protein